MNVIIADNETWKVERIHIDWKEEFYQVTLIKENLRIIISKDELEALRAILNTPIGEQEQEQEQIEIA